jgi:anti-anti-sigma factor
MTNVSIQVEQTSSGEAGSEERVSISGEIAGDQIKSLESELLKILQNLSEGILLTVILKDINRIDSRGVSLIVGLFKECTLRKITLTIVADSMAFRILSQIKLNRVLTIKEEN